MKQPIFKTITLEKIVGGGQTLGRLEDGKKAFVWGGLPSEKVTIQLTKKKSSYVEGIVTEVLESSPERIVPKDPDSFLSTSPWQIMAFDAEQHYKAALIEEAFELHDIVLPEPIRIYTDGNAFAYRNKIEFSWWWDNDADQLDLAFFRRGTHGKIPVEGTSLARPEINQAAIRIRDLLRRRGTSAYDLKTVIIRSNTAGEVIAQLYVKTEGFPPLTTDELTALDIHGFELIYSNPKSPASVITVRLQQWGIKALSDTILGVPFTYATEGFFQINLPVYEQALRDMQQWVEPDKPTLDLYSGVGTIGLTIGGDTVTLVESNKHAVREMKRNIKTLGKNAHAVLATSESALEHIDNNSCVIVDPPRAGLHEDVVKRLLETKPTRIIYLSCNPVTQARDVARLAESYGIRAHQGYNFFPRTPHIEHLVILDKK
ncbi:MAG TPA: RsmD family RNA methyltransferase [Candidatus Saccharimonadales bacterium]|nr:RsmD family RNA methyltransferase [Candidatus Saccharimonadales bacterium]